MWFICSTIRFIAWQFHYSGSVFHLAGVLIKTVRQYNKCRAHWTNRNCRIFYILKTKVNNIKMHSIVRNVFRSSALKSWAANQSHSMIMSRNAVRTFSHMSKRFDAPRTIFAKHSIGCTCGCNVKFVHTKGNIHFISRHMQFQITLEMVKWT